MNAVQSFSKLINECKAFNPSLLEKEYYGLKVGDIVRSAASEKYLIVYPSESYLAGPLIPVRRLNNPKNLKRLTGGKSGFQVFSPADKQDIKITGKTDYFATEWLAWESDDDTSIKN